MCKHLLQASSNFKGSYFHDQPRFSVKNIIVIYLNFLLMNLNDPPALLAKIFSDGHPMSVLT